MLNWGTCRGLLVLVMLACLQAAGKDGSLTINLRKQGYPKRAFERERCAASFDRYEAVRWLDAGRLLVAISTGSTCPKTDTFHFPNSLRLVVFDLRGAVLASTELPYEGWLDLPRSLWHGGVWIGPGPSVLVASAEILSISGGQLTIFDERLEKVEVVQVKPAAYAQDKFTRFDERRFEGVAGDRRAVLFLVRNQNGPESVCVKYTAVPLRQASDCGPGELTAAYEQFEPAVAYLIPKGQDAIYGEPGRAVEGSRASVFLTKEENGYCQLAGVLCPRNGTFVVYEMGTGREIFRRRFPTGGQVVLSPDGRNAASLHKETLEIFAIP